jgi:hypothetical protein
MRCPHGPDLKVAQRSSSRRTAISAAGRCRQPFPEGLLKVGDVVRVEIDGIGVLENTVIDEPEGFVVPESDEVPAWAA